MNPSGVAISPVPKFFILNKIESSEQIASNSILALSQFGSGTKQRESGKICASVQWVCPKTVESQSTVTQTRKHPSANGGTTPTSNTYILPAWAIQGMLVLSIFNHGSKLTCTAAVAAGAEPRFRYFML